MSTNNIFLMMKAQIFSFRIGTLPFELEKGKNIYSNITSIQYICIPSQYNKVRKIKDIQVVKEKVKLSLFPGNMIM